MQKPIKRVLHFIDSGGVYGAERVILNLSVHLKKTDNITPIVGCIVNNLEDTNALYDAALRLGIDACKIPIRNTGLLRDIPKAARQCKALGINIIHSHGYKPSVFGFFISALTKIPIMATCHLWFSPKQGPMKMRSMIWLEKKLYRFFPKIVAVSEPIKQILLSNGVAKKKVSVIRNGVDVPEISSTNTLEKLRIDLDIAPNDFCILNTGRLAQQKAQWILIEAVRILKEKGENVRALIVGEGPLRDDLYHQILDQQLDANVQLLGFRNDIPDLLALSHLFVLPSLDEGMPMSLLEAAAAKKPIITTLVGDIDKLVKHLETGYVIPIENASALADAIIELKHNSTLGSRLSHNAYQQLLENYSSSAMTEHYRHIYQQLLAQA